MTEIFIKELDPDMIKPSIKDIQSRTLSRSSKITFIGKPGTGKTTTLTSILYEKRMCFPSAMIVSGTEDSNHHFETIFPPTFIHNSLDIPLLEKFVQRQKISAQYLENPWSLLVLDDCLDDPKIFNTPFFHSFYKNGRHLNMLYILSLQYAMDIKPVIRTCIDGVFIMRETNLRNRRSIYENYAGVIPSFKLFCELMDAITNDYTALYIHNQTQSNDWTDCVFWYKAKPIPEGWKFGSPSYWDFHTQRYNDKSQNMYI